MNLYHEDILEHYKDPQHYGLLTDATHKKIAMNPTCGDQFTFTIKVDDSGVIQDVGFEGEGCAISTASASMLTDEIIGKPLADVVQMNKEFVLELIGLELSPARLKCALLPLEAVQHLDS